MIRSDIDMGREPIFPLLMKMSWPSVVAMLAVALSNAIDAFWLARLSTEALAALTFCFPIQLVLAAIGVGTGVGAGSFASRMFGARKDHLACKTAGQALTISLVLGLLVIVATHLFVDAFLFGFGASESLLPLARRYLLVVVWSSPFLIFMMMANNLLRAEGRPRRSMGVILLLALSGAILDPLLIFGVGPMPAMGLSGAALTAVCAAVLSALLSLYCLTRRSSRYRLRMADLKPDRGVIRAIYQTGFPSVMMNLMVSLVMAAFNHQLKPFGSEAVATLGLCFRIHGIVLMVLFGIGQGVMPVVGFHEGARQYRRLLESVRVAGVSSFAVGGVSSLILILWARPLLHFFTTDDTLLRMAVPALRLYVASLALIGPTVVWINMFVGLGKGVTAMTLMLLRDGCLLLPLLLLLPMLLGVTGVWAAQLLANVLAFFLVYIRVATEARRIRQKMACSRLPGDGFGG